MKTVCVLCQKGGVGKTTFSLHLAAAAIEAGQSTIVLDTDPQASATMWRDMRANPIPEVAHVAPARLERSLEAARKAGADMAIIDTPPQSETGILAAAKSADFVIAVTRIGALDFLALKSTKSLLDVAGVPSALVLNWIKPGARAVIEEARAAAEATGFQLAPVWVHDWTSIRNAMLSFKLVQEFEPEGKADIEFRALYAWLSEQLEGGRTRRAA
jgi:chromosome partitioning protein